MRLWLLAAAISFGGCTLLTAFNPEGQPCDGAAPPAQQCLDGYRCEMDKCVKGQLDGGQ